MGKSKETAKGGFNTGSQTQTNYVRVDSPQDRGGSKEALGQTQATKKKHWE
jgi:hypothetical protein